MPSLSVAVELRLDSVVQFPGCPRLPGDQAKHHAVLGVLAIFVAANMTCIKMFVPALQELLSGQALARLSKCSSLALV